MRTAGFSVSLGFCRRYQRLRCSLRLRKALLLFTLRVLACNRSTEASRQSSRRQPDNQRDNHGPRVTYRGKDGKGFVTLQIAGFHQAVLIVAGSLAGSAGGFAQCNIQAGTGHHV